MLKFRQDGGLVTAGIGFEEGGNNLRIRSSEHIQFIVRDADQNDILAADIDKSGNLHLGGDVQIDGRLLVEKVSYITIPPSGFIDKLNEATYETDLVSTKLAPGEVFGSFIDLTAPLILPQGAEIIKITCWWVDNVNYNPLLRLYRYNLNTGQREMMAQMASHWNDADRHLQYVPNDSSTYASDTIEHNVIDNELYGYSFEVYLPASESSSDFCGLGGVRIEYRYNP